MGSHSFRLLFFLNLFTICLLIAAPFDTEHLLENQQTFAFVRTRNSDRGDDFHLSDADTFLIPSKYYNLKGKIVFPAAGVSTDSSSIESTPTLRLLVRKVCAEIEGALKLKISFNGGYTVVTINARRGIRLQTIDITCTQGPGSVIDTNLRNWDNLFNLPPNCLGPSSTFGEYIGYEIEVLELEGCYPYFIVPHPTFLFEDVTNNEELRPAGPWYTAENTAPLDIPVQVDSNLNQVEVSLTQPTDYVISFGKSATAKFPIMRFYVDDTISSFSATIRFFEDPTCQLFVSVDSHHLISFETSAARELTEDLRANHRQEMFKPHSALRRWYVNFPELRYLEDSYTDEGIFFGSLQLCSVKTQLTPEKHQFLSLRVVPNSVSGDDCVKCVLIVGGSLHDDAALAGFSVPEDASKLNVASIFSVQLIIGIGLLAIALAIMTVVVYFVVKKVRKRRKRALRADQLNSQGRQWAEENDNKSSKDWNSNRSPGTLSRIIAAELEHGATHQPDRHPQVIVPKQPKMADDIMSRDRSSDNKTDDALVPTEFDYHAFENVESYTIAGVRPYQSEPKMKLTLFQDFWDIFDYFMSNDRPMPVGSLGAKNTNIFFSVRDCVAVSRKGFRSLANRMLEPIDHRRVPPRKPGFPPPIILRIFVLMYDPPWIEIHCRGPPPAFLFTIFDCQECQKIGTQLDDTAGLISDALVLKPWKDFCCEVKRLEIDRHRFVSYCNGGSVQPKNAASVDHLFIIRGRGNSPNLPKCSHGCLFPPDAIGHINDKELHCSVLNGLTSLPGSRFTQVNGDGTVVPSGLPSPPKKQSAIVVNESSAVPSEANNTKVTLVKETPSVQTPPKNVSAKTVTAIVQNEFSSSKSSLTSSNAVPPLDKPTHVKFDSTRSVSHITSQTGESAKETQSEPHYPAIN